MVLKPLIYILVTYAVVTADDSWFYQNQDSSEKWQGSWFPYAPGKLDDNEIIPLEKNSYDSKHVVVMGVKNKQCDDGKTNLEIDWDMNPKNYTCYSINRRIIYKTRSDIQPLYSHDYIPKSYNAPHQCMSDPIYYSVTIPTYGAHRPLWAKYGEYTFLPRQRWVHNLEHGAVIMLYHPCADKNEVNILRTLVRKCLYRHIITPFNLLPPERPLALVTWGNRLLMSKVDPDIVLDFIRKHALRGPEQTYRDGQYDFLLEEHAEVVSDIGDGELCQFFNFVE